MEFDIFRKPTYTDIIIPFCSAHPFSIKKSAFFRMVHRLVEVPLNHANFMKELNTIYTIAENKGYNIEMVDDILRKVQRKKTMDSLYSPGNLNKTPLTFKKIWYLPNLPYKLFTEFKRSSITYLLHLKQIFVYLYLTPLILFPTFGTPEFRWKAI
jgi:hypothetical protein